MRRCLHRATNEAHEEEVVLDVQRSGTRHSGTVHAAEVAVLFLNPQGNVLAGGKREIHLNCNVRHRWYIYNSHPHKNATDTGINYPRK